MNIIASRRTLGAAGLNLANHRNPFRFTRLRMLLNHQSAAKHSSPTGQQTPFLHCARAIGLATCLSIEIREIFPCADSPTKCLVWGEAGKEHLARCCDRWRHSIPVCESGHIITLPVAFTSLTDVRSYPYSSPHNDFRRGTHQRHSLWRQGAKYI